MFNIMEYRYKQQKEKPPVCLFIMAVILLIISLIYFLKIEFEKEMEGKNTAKSSFILQYKDDWNVQI